MELVEMENGYIYERDYPENKVYKDVCEDDRMYIYLEINGYDTFDKIYEYLESNPKYKDVGLIGAGDLNIYFTVEEHIIHLQCPELLEGTIYISEPKEELENTYKEICKICLEIQKNFLDTLKL